MNAEPIPQLKVAIIEQPLSLKRESREEKLGKKSQNVGRSRMKPRGIGIPGTSRMVRESVAAATITLAGATGMAYATDAAGFIGNQDNQTSHKQIASSMPSERLSIYDSRESIVTDEDIQRVFKEVPTEYLDNAKISIPLIAQALKERGLGSKEIFAYALATVEHESLFEAREEIDGREQALKYEYDGGENFFGRGLIMLTGKGNYEETGKVLGFNFAENPELLLDTKISAKILAYWFEKKGTAKYAQKLDYVHARKTINAGEFGMDEEPFKSTPWKVAQRAFDYLGRMQGPATQQSR